jgi:DAK2 domain fusion protein YloV
VAVEALDAVATRDWCHRAVEALAEAREEIDALNVFPVPDGDTGTNLLLTMVAAARAVDDARPAGDLDTTCRAAAHGALMGARGNSGIILSQLLRGAGDVLGQEAVPRGRALGAALGRAADLAYAAVAEPIEGTMLTVARAAAAAAAAAGCDELDTVAMAAAHAAHEAVARTPEQLDVLASAGVVDAGGQGLAVLLDALVSVVTGAQPAAASRPTQLPDLFPVAAGGGNHPAPADGPAFEVMYLLDADTDAVQAMRATLAGLGDSLVVVGGDGLWNVHVHVDDVGAAIEAGVQAGRPHRIRVTHFGDAAARRSDGREELGRRGVVAVVAGDGLAALFEVAGATVVPGGPGLRPSTSQLLEGIQRAHTGEVVVLPNDGDSLGVAEAAAIQARADGIRVAVIPTRTSVQAIAAIAVHDADRSFDDDVVAMTSAAGHMRHGAITIAAREAVTMAGICQPGDVLGVVDGDFAIIGADLPEVASQVVDRLLSGGGELVTLVTGADTDPALAEQLIDHVRRTRPEVDTAVYEGGQQRYPLLIGVE